MHITTAQTDLKSPVTVERLHRTQYLRGKKKKEKKDNPPPELGIHFSKKIQVRQPL